MYMNLRTEAPRMYNKEVNHLEDSSGKTADETANGSTDTSTDETELEIRQRLVTLRLIDTYRSSNEGGSGVTESWVAEAESWVSTIDVWGGTLILLLDRGGTDEANEGENGNLGELHFEV
jgi:cell wall-associated NlpC family hydrolase